MHNLTRLPEVERLIELALSEDIGRGDVTTESVLAGASEPIAAAIVAREPLVLFGVDVAAEIFRRVDDTVEVEIAAADGGALRAGDSAMRLSGNASSILIAERTALNFLQRLSGIATLSRQFADAVGGTDARVVDTRKTLPGYRVLSKAAVRAGGCFNHRADLGSGVLIKDNHIRAVGSVAGAIEAARARAPHSHRIEVEVDTLAELAEALGAGADVVLLDNMSPELVADGVERAHQKGVLVEVSGGITLDTVRAYADAGADIISAGALTHSAAAVDLALDFES